VVYSLLDDLAEGLKHLVAGRSSRAADKVLE